jgi:DNA-binding NtrC family response regulator
MLDWSFHEDLYYRLNVINLVLPPLRERNEGIVPLAEYLLRKHAGAGRSVSLTLNLKHAMVGYQWPGNVRELENVKRKLIVLRSPEVIAKELHAKASRRIHLPATDSSELAEVGQSAPTPIDRTPILEQVIKAKQLAETEAIQAALNSTRWNRKQAAALLKIDYKALLYKMKKLGLEDNVVAFAPGSNEEPHAMTTSAGGN